MANSLIYNTCVRILQGNNRLFGDLPGYDSRRVTIRTEDPQMDIEIDSKRSLIVIRSQPKCSLKSDTIEPERFDLFLRLSNEITTYASIDYDSEHPDNSPTIRSSQAFPKIDNVHYPIALMIEIHERLIVALNNAINDLLQGESAENASNRYFRVFEI